MGTGIGTMSEENNNLPALESAEELMWKEVRKYLLDPREDYPEPYHMLEYNGVPFSKVGGLSAISGQKKNGKSFVLTQIMAAVLGCGSERTQQYLPGLRVPERTIEYLGHEPKVLYIDTEMERLSSAKVLRRVHWLCGWDMKIPNERFAVSWLKNTPKDSDMKPHVFRYDIVRKTIECIKPDMVIIDGLRDLLASINDEESGTMILNELSSLAEERNMSIWCALHQNPSRKNDDDEAKMRGWIGTELGNKVSDTLVSIKNKTASGVTFTVKQQDARDKDMEDWKFTVTDDAGKLGVPKIVGSGIDLPVREKVKADTVQDIRSWIKDAKDIYDFPMSRKDIKEKIFGEIGKQKNRDMQQADLQVALNMKFLTESTLKANGYYMLDPNDEILDSYPF